MTSDSRKRKGNWKGSIWVGATCTLIAFIAYTSQLFVILPTYARGIGEAKLWFIVFNIVVTLIFANYAACIATDPGGVPAGWQPLKEVQEGEGRYCRACDAFKPPRAHHCRQCRRCVLRMDHHVLCAPLLRILTKLSRFLGPWVNNCVGHRNYAAFLRFLFLVDIGIIMHLYKISQCAFGRAVYTMEPTTQFMVMLILNYAASLPVLIAVGVFSIYHLFCLLQNATTIEGFEKEKVEKLYRRGHLRIRVVYPFHLGLFGNLKAVFGSNVLLWGLPWQRSPGDGRYFAVSQGSDPLAQYHWPPKDPFRVSSVPRTTAPNGIEQLACPPFAQDYDTGRAAIDEDDDDDVPLASKRYRRGSEGFEIRPFSSSEREQQVRKSPDRYHRYDPNDENDSDADISSDE